MSFQYFSKNGKVLPILDATIALSSIEYSYGYGVYESLRVVKGKVYFVHDHLQRLMESASIIGLEHDFQTDQIKHWIESLISANNVDTCNIKILIIGGKTKQDATLYIECLNPLFADRKLYKKGAKLVTYMYERAFPHAKTLNMLQSYLAYRKARENDSYDALLINNEGNVTEGTRTNVFSMKDTTIYSPYEKDILLGVTRKIVLEVAKENNITVIERDIPLEQIANFDTVFISSTSTGIMPICQVDDTELQISEEFRAFKRKFDSYIELSNGELH